MVIMTTFNSPCPWRLDNRTILVFLDNMWPIILKLLSVKIICKFMNKTTNKKILFLIFNMLLSCYLDNYQPLPLLCKFHLVNYG